MIVDALGITVRFEIGTEYVKGVSLFSVKRAGVLRVVFERGGFSGPEVASD